MDPTLCCEAPQWEVNRSGASGGRAAGSPGHPRPAPDAPAAERRPQPAEQRRPAGAGPRGPPASAPSPPGAAGVRPLRTALGGGRGASGGPARGAGLAAPSGTSRSGLSFQMPRKGCHGTWIGSGQRGWDAAAPCQSLTFGPAEGAFRSWGSAPLRCPSQITLICGSPSPPK